MSHGMPAGTSISTAWRIATLTDNTANTLVHASTAWPLASTASVSLEFTSKRGNNVLAGRFTIVMDTATGAIRADLVDTAATGVTFAVAVNGVSLELRYTTTATGVGATMSFRETSRVVF